MDRISLRLATEKWAQKVSARLRELGIVEAVAELDDENDEEITEYFTKLDDPALEQLLDAVGYGEVWTWSHVVILACQDMVADPLATLLAANAEPDVWCDEDPECSHPIFAITAEAEARLAKLTQEA